jgi:hypothetical protein
MVSWIEVPRLAHFEKKLKYGTLPISTIRSAAGHGRARRAMASHGKRALGRQTGDGRNGGARDRLDLAAPASLAVRFAFPINKGGYSTTNS